MEFIKKYWYYIAGIFALIFALWPDVVAYLEVSNEIANQNEAVAKVNDRKSEDNEGESKGLLRQSLQGDATRNSIRLNNALSQFGKLEQNQEDTQKSIRQVETNIRKENKAQLEKIEGALTEISSKIGDYDNSLYKLQESFKAKDQEFKEKVNALENLVKQGGISQDNNAPINLDAISNSMTPKSDNTSPDKSLPKKPLDKVQKIEKAVPREHKLIWGSEGDAKGIGQAEMYELDEKKASKSYVVLPMGFCAEAILDHRLAITTKDTNKEAIFTLTTKFHGISGFAIDFRNMKVKGTTKVELTGEGIGRVIVNIKQIQLVLDKGESYTKEIVGYVKTKTESGDMEGLNITKIAKPLAKRFFADLTSGLASGYSQSLATSVETPEGGQISRTAPEDTMKVGMAGAGEKAASNLSKTYDDMLGQILPTIAIPEGTKVKIYISEQVEFVELALEHDVKTELTQLY